jgi:hypothetical protein
MPAAAPAAGADRVKEEQRQQQQSRQQVFQGSMLELAERYQGEGQSLYGAAAEASAV